MSCHDIGRGLNSVVEVVLSEFDNGNISHKVAHKIIKQARNAVNYCDGNSFEAIICFEEQGRCTCCFKKVNNILNVYKLPYGLEHLSDNLISASYGDKLLGGYICEDCALQI